MKIFHKYCSANLLTSVVILVTGIVSTQALATEIYSWTDKNGVVHFGDRPPAGQQTEYINVPEAYRPGTSDAYPSRDAQEATSSDAGASAIPDEETPVPLTAAQSRRAKMAKDREERRETQAETDRMCQKHRKRVEQIEPARRVFYTNEQGESVRMDDDLRVSLVEESKTYIRKNCE